MGELLDVDPDPVTCVLGLTDLQLRNLRTLLDVAGVNLVRFDEAHIEALPKYFLVPAQPE